MMEVALALQLFFSLRGPTFSLFRTLGLGLLSGCPNFPNYFFVPTKMRQRCCYCDESLKSCSIGNEQKQCKNENLCRGQRIEPAKERGIGLTNSLY